MPVISIVDVYSWVLAYSLTLIMACCIKQVLNFDVFKIFAFLLQFFFNVLRYFPLSQDPDFLFFSYVNFKVLFSHLIFYSFGTEVAGKKGLCVELKVA